MSKTIFIVNKGCHDYSAAERFGNLVFLSDGSFNVLSTSRMFRKFAAALQTSKPDDFIIPTGLSTMSIIACCCFAVLHGRLNLLIYYTKNGKGKGVYRERTLVFEELIKKERAEHETS